MENYSGTKYELVSQGLQGPFPFILVEYNTIMPDIVPLVIRNKWREGSIH